MSCSLRLPPPGMRDQKPLLQAVAERKIDSPWIEGYQTHYWGCTCNNDIINNAPQNWNLFFKIPHEMNCFNTNVWICIIGPSLAHYSRPDSIGFGYYAYHTCNPIWCDYPYYTAMKPYSLFHYRSYFKNSLHSLAYSIKRHVRERDWPIWKYGGVIKR